MKTFIAAFFVASFAHAGIVIKNGTYESDRCFVEVTKTSQGGTYIELASKTQENSLMRDHIVLDKKGSPIDGPGLCFDQVAMGNISNIEVSTIGNGNENTTTIKCGGMAYPITLKATIITNAKNELVGFTESSATRQLLLKKTRTMECGNLKIIK